MRVALDLFDLSFRMFRHRLAREGLSEPEIETRLQNWLADRPGAEAGDAAGQALSWPRD